MIYYSNPVLTSNTAVNMPIYPPHPQLPQTPSCCLTLGLLPYTGDTSVWLTEGVLFPSWMFGLVVFTVGLLPCVANG